MDVSIAVSLIRGQMGAVVERAVNVAVETVLAEMLRVVGVRFEELKAQLAALRREAALRERESDGVRARLRYTELKLKYYRQGVEEELQQRAAGLGGAPPGPGGGASSQEECTSSRSPSRPVVRVRLPAGSGSPEPLKPLTQDTCTAAASAQRIHQEDECRWGGAVHVAPVGVHVAPVGVHVAPPPAPPPRSPGAPLLADSSMRPSSTVQVKQEVQHQEEEEVCIKEEPEEELLDPLQPLGPAPESEAQSWRPPGVRADPETSLSPAGPSSCAPPPLAAAPPHLAPPPPSGGGPWPRDRSLYEEYKLRRNELRRRNLNRRRELEKTLPQPLLADLVRERREKTRLRVARWRARRKLQACMEQMQGGASGPPQTGFPPQQLQAPRASVGEQIAPPPIGFLPPPSSPLLLMGPGRPPHEHTVSSSSGFARVSPPPHDALQ